MKAKAIGSVIVLVIALINVVLGAFGITPLGIDEDAVYSAVSLVVLIVGAIGSTWYNFSVTDPAKAADLALGKLKSGEIDIVAFLKLISTVPAAIKEVKDANGEG
jgi:SPP1 family holin